MPLEIFVFEKGIVEAVDYDVVLPGQKRHVVSTPFGQPDKIYEIFCRADDALSTLHVIFPKLIYGEKGHQKALFSHLETENRAKIIRRGEELDLKVRQRVESFGRRKFIEATLRLTHR